MTIDGKIEKLKTTVIEKGEDAVSEVLVYKADRCLVRQVLQINKQNEIIKDGDIMWKDRNDMTGLSQKLCNEKTSHRP